jgi:hypothetical protein
LTRTIDPLGSQFRGKLDMEIWVTFAHGKLICSPDPAGVQQGTPVTWRFRADELSVPLLRWTVYFNHSSPFSGQVNQLTADTIPVSGQHTRTTGAMSADKPGDYKYGVRVVDSSNQQTLGDDDPRLIVTATP